jgi:hypothetical protein
MKAHKVTVTMRTKTPFLNTRIRCTVVHTTLVAYLINSHDSCPVRGSYGCIDCCMSYSRNDTSHATVACGVTRERSLSIVPFVLPNIHLRLVPKSGGYVSSESILFQKYPQSCVLR